ncbi:MAG: hypothetical protein RL430_522 [Actinomycetota bacterium]
MGSTTMFSSSGPTMVEGSIAGPSTVNRSGMFLAVAPVNVRPFGLCHEPAREMPTPMMSYFSGSAARITCDAVTQLTSCSADWPPNRMTSVVRGPFIPFDGTRR